ncbi:hypothetical protein [Candidatus Viadribacter manganicus]|nr:hypothetical protein [Candidatus Viadribacter manganicus]
MADKKSSGPAKPAAAGGKKLGGTAAPPGQVGQAGRPLNPNATGKNKK